MGCRFGYASRVGVCSTKERCSGGDLDELLERCRMPFGVAENMGMCDIFRLFPQR